MRQFISLNIKRFLKKNIIHPCQKQILIHRLSKEVKEKRELGNLVFIIATPEHGNLGDHAIVFSERRMLESSGYENRIIEIANSDFLKFRSIIKSFTTKEDLIVIDGGGNLGSLWPWEDDKISDIIDLFSDNSIIVFPQTCFYDSGEKSRQRLLNNNNIYSRARDLTIALRDQSSFDFCSSHFSTNVRLLLVPDIVLCLAGEIVTNVKTQRDGILLCLRNDHEKILTESDEALILSLASELNLSVRTTTTVLNRFVNKNQREYFLKNKFDEFASAKLVITDRLHAMIFAYITNTPCIAFDNLSKKVSGVYNISDRLSNVVICDDKNMLSKYLIEYCNLELVTNQFGKVQYKELIEKIKNTII